MDFFYQFDSAIGVLVLEADDQNLLRLYFPNEFQKEVAFTATPLLLEAEKQLSAYFSGELRKFSLPYDLNQLAKREPSRLVLKAISQIPYGAVESYGGLKLSEGASYGARFVGQACHQNPLPILIPCHRICGKDGTMKGYAGGLALKKFLLDLENPHHGYTVN